MSFLRQGFCFTGKAKLGGRDVTRGDLEAFIRRAGGWVSNKAAQADILVASRTDTVKARDAINSGKRVCSYDEFFTMAGVRSVHDLGGVGEPQPMAPPAPPPAPITDASLDEAAAEIEGWGMF